MDGKFADELVWDLFKPAEISGSTVIGYFDYSKHYRQTCSYIAAEISYHSKKVVLFLIPPTDEPIETLKGEELIDGDSILDLHYNNETFEERVGSLEEMKEKLRGIHGGGRTRKGNKRRVTRKHK